MGVNLRQIAGNNSIKDGRGADLLDSSSVENLVWGLQFPWKLQAREKTEKMLCDVMGLKLS